MLYGTDRSSPSPGTALDGDLSCLHGPPYVNYKYLLGYFTTVAPAIRTRKETVLRFLRDVLTGPGTTLLLLLFDLF